LAGSTFATIASNLLQAFSGAAGASIAAAIILIVFLLAAAHVLSGRHAVESSVFVAFAWSAVWLVNTVIGWSGGVAGFG
jgi:hypothetical protein